MRIDSRSEPTMVEAGAGRPFRFSLRFEGDRSGRLESWMGSAWASALGVTMVIAFATLAGVLSTVLPATGLPPEVMVMVGAAFGAVACALQLRTRTVHFLRREGVWALRHGWRLWPGGWHPITDESPLRLEREPLSSVEGFTLHAGSRRLLSFLGDPSVPRGVARVFRGAGVPVAVKVKSRDGQGRG